MIKTILFDLDGTLLPMDQDQFTAEYFRLLAQKAAGHGYEPERLTRAIWQGTAAMVKNDGSQSNEDAFWQCFTGIYGPQARDDEGMFEEFYRKEFQQARSLCRCEPKAAETVRAAKELGFGVGLATNPLFPAIATESRIRWAGLVPEDFLFYTTYENSRYCKPNPTYYTQLCAEHGLDPRECLMVGNDAAEDAQAATAAGMQAFLLTDCLLNKHSLDISAYPQGSFDELMAHLTRLAEDIREAQI